MAHVTQLEQSKNKVSRDGFDLSRKVMFTSKLGQLTPVLCEQLYPGDKVHINLDDFVRTHPLQTASFTRIKNYYDFFFVPIRLLWRDAPSYFTQMANTAKQATAIDKNRSVGTKSPYFLSNDLYLNIISHLGTDNTLTKPTERDFLGFNRYQNAHRLLSHLGYYNVCALKTPQKKLNENGTYTLSFEDNLIPADPQNNIELNPFPLLAYQKVYQDHYRQTQWENEASNTYNIDYLSSGEKVPIEKLFGKDYRLASSEPNMFDIRYANLPKDLFLGLLPSQQYGAQSTIDLSDNIQLTNGIVNTAKTIVGGNLQMQINSGSISSGIPELQNQDQTSGAVYSAKQFNNLGTGLKEIGYYSKIGYTRETWKNILSQLGANISILQLRAAEAWQRYKEVSISNEQDYVSQIQAHWDVDVSSLMAGLSTRLGGTASDIEVSAIVNNNLTGDNSTQIKAIGTSNCNGSIDFDCKEHGILLCINHQNIFPDHEVYGYDPLVLKTEFSDYVQPEFDRLGYERFPKTIVNGQVNSTNNTFAFTTRYYDAKTSYDRVLGDFNRCLGGTLVDWITPFTYYNFFKNDNSPWWQSVGYEYFKTSPHLTDTITTPANSSYQTDIFLHGLFLKFNIVRNISRNSLPY